MKQVDELVFRFNHLESKIKKIHQFLSSMQDKFDDEKKNRRFIAIASGVTQDFKTIEDLCLKLNNCFIKEPSSKIPNFEVDKKLSNIQDLIFDIEAGLFNAQSGIKESDKSIVKSEVDSVDVSCSLPAIKLTEFNGSSLSEWLHFRDLFKALVIDDSKLPKIKKFMYLRSCLKGEALSLIVTLPITGDNFELAWKLLCDRFNDDRTLTNYYIESLIDLPMIHRDSSSLKYSSSHIKECIGALSQLGNSVDEWNPILIFILRRKLGRELIEKWEMSILSTSSPTHKDFVEFLLNEAKVVEGLLPKSTKDKNNYQSKKPNSKPLTFSLTTNPHNNDNSFCKFCNRTSHLLSNCVAFTQSPPKDRYKFVKANSLCCLCLSDKHFLKECPTNIKCCYCNSRSHSSLLHFDVKTKSRNNPSDHSSSKPNCEPITNCAVLKSTDNRPEVVLLSTVIAYVTDKSGRLHRLKILLDTASQGTFIIKHCVDKLELPIKEASIPIQGLACSELGLSKGKVALKILAPSNRSISLNVEALVVDKIADYPRFKVKDRFWPHLAKVKLADPTWFEPGDIHLLLGSEYIAQVLLGNSIIGPKGTPSALETIFGYTLVGKITGSGPLQTFCTLTDLDSTVKKFWSIEEPPSPKIISDDDKICDEIFENSVSRFDGGRFVVKLPFRKIRPPLEDSRQKALHRYLLLESRLLKNPELYAKYKEFMHDYESQGHMVLANPLPLDSEYYFVPHHCIQTPKFKVVFDFSMTTIRGPSLNEVLYSGEKLLLNILDILMNFRLHPVVLIADIHQFYRNISLSEEHWNYHRIFWRDDSSKPLQEWCLTTVTYGVVSSPHTAIKTLHRLVNLDGDSYPLASSALLESAYMDDIVCSVKTLDEGIQLRKELVELLARGGFHLKKWISNCPELLKGLNREDLLFPEDDYSFSFSHEENSAKILGLAWNPYSDFLSFRIDPQPQEITKRKILSELVQLWDPLGLLSPTIFIGKLLLRHIWQLGIGWDETPPKDVCQHWTRFRNELPSLKKLAIPRLLYHSPGLVQLHCFADASEKGYACVVYLRNTYLNEVKISLVLAKSKIAPLKNISVPRLELSALVLASKLASYIVKLFKAISFESVIIWSDSLVALHWVKSSPHRWKTFVANRVSFIQELTAPSCFRYIPTELNIADIASRGCFPSELLTTSLWWAGPEFLKFEESNWPQIPKSLADKELEVPEIKEVKILTSFLACPADFLIRFSSWTKLRRITAWCFRFIHNCRLRSCPNKRHLSRYLTTQELRNSSLLWIKFTQNQEFGDLITLIRSDKLIPASYRKLTPFLDSDGILRVGGRLGNSNLSFAAKHPILLPKNSHLTNLIVDFYHEFWLHPGASTLHGLIRNQFWIISGRALIRSRLLKCLKCFRCQPSSVQPLMGNLPPSRLNQIKPFGITGVDYAGPLIIKNSNLRKASSSKAYICLFVCFATKAIHLELASDLTTRTFLGAFRRFIARRGPIYELHSDNGTNFVGAKNQLDHWYRLVSSREFVDQAGHWLGEQGIKWSFIPSFSAHMGSIWEANIKSTKRILFASVGSQVLTFEELYTVLVQIEAVLNSRPLTPLSSDPNDLEFLTPSHFLVQGPPGSIVEPYTPQDAPSLRNRWRLVQQIVASFWNRWSKEYLTSLQIRYKWNKPAPNLSEGNFVLLKDPNLPPLRWKLGRIVNTYPGKDGIVRVADVRTTSGIVNRAVVKLCPLPLQD